MRGENAFRQIFEIHLVNDANTRRNELESFESLLSPLQKLITLAIALEFHFQVELQRPRGTEEIHLHRVIDHKIDRYERLDDFWIAAELFHGGTHRGEIHHERHAGEILQDDARDNERNFRIRRGFCVPIRECLDIFASDFFPIAVPHHGFEHDPNAHRQPRNFADALLLQHRQGIQKPFAAISRVEFLQRLKFVVHCHVERSPDIPLPTLKAIAAGSFGFAALRSG